jgi:hypothetical protein
MYLKDRLEGRSVWYNDKNMAEVAPGR